MKIVIDSKYIKKGKLSLRAIILHGFIKALVKDGETFQEDGYVHVSSKMVEAELGINPVIQSQYLNELTEAGLIATKKIGFPGPKRCINPFPSPKEVVEEAPKKKAKVKK